jgi:hypothetical protein
MVLPVGVLKARKLGKADKVTGLLLHAACSALAAADNVRERVAENMQDIWGLISYGFANEHFLKQPSPGAHASEVLSVHAAFAGFVGSILWWNALSDFKDSKCSREKLLSLIFDKIKKSGPSAESAWFRNAAWMLLSSVCSPPVLKIRTYSFTSDHDRLAPEEDRLMQLLQQITNHIKQDVVIEGYQYQPGETWDVVRREGTQTLSALSRARAAELQDIAVVRISELLQDDPSSSANSATNEHVLALGMAVLRAAIDMECVHICSAELLPKIMASVLGENMSTESQQSLTLLDWWSSQASGSPAQRKVHKAISHLERMEEYFDTLSEYTLHHHALALRGGLVDFRLEDVRRSCCKFLSERDVRADKMEEDEFGPTQNDSQSFTQTREKEEEWTALRLLLKLLAYEPDIEVPSFDLDCIRAYIDSIRGSLQDVVHCFQLLCEFAHPSFEQLLSEIHTNTFQEVVGRFERVKDTESLPQDLKKKEMKKLARTQAANENNVVLVCGAFCNAGKHIWSCAPLPVYDAVTNMVCMCVMCMYVCNALAVFIILLMVHMCLQTSQVKLHDAHQYICNLKGTFLRS